MKYFCPVCDDILLCHLHQHKITWFCLRCRQEMPNFDLLELNLVQNQTSQPIREQNKQTNHNSTKVKTKKKVTIIHQLDLVINEGKKRLEVVSFILSQINYLVRHGFSDIYRDETEKKSQLNLPEEKLKPHKLPLAYFLRDSEIIVLYICQAILAHDISVLNNQRLQELKATYVKSNIPMEQIVYLIHLIKTSVLDFIRSTAFDSVNLHQNQSHYLDTEIANYFDVVIASII